MPHITAYSLSVCLNMKFTCPHCGEKGVSAFSKFFSREESPAQCSRCKEYSIEPPGVAEAYSHFVGMGVVSSGILSMFVDSIWPITFVLLIAIIYPIVMLFSMQLTVVEKGEIKAARKKKCLIILGFLALLAIGVFIDAG